jgi:triphosphoribosyl-dephospho-CoA synthetase
VNEPSEITRLRADLRAHYEQWRQLTEEEGSAIAAGQWMQVELLQKTKRQLQSFIDSTRQDLRDACKACGKAVQGIEREFYSLIEELLALEARNNQTVVDRRTQATAEEQRLQQAVQKLHQIRVAYALPRPALWESYV